MRRFAILTLLWLCVIISAYANDTLTFRTPALVREMLKDTSASLSAYTEWHFTPQKEGMQYISQYLIKAGGELFLLAPGSGRVYKVDPASNPPGAYRIDTTFYSGYNFMAIYFGWKNTLYSLGGYGFWRTNGQLRYYNSKTRDWDVVPLNQELGFEYREGLWQVDEKGHTLYLTQFIQHNQALKGIRVDYFQRSMKLDLETGIWTELGTLNTEWDVRANKSGIGPLAQNEMGVLLSRKNVLFLLDIKNNQVYELRKSLQDSILSHCHQSFFSFEEGTNPMYYLMKGRELWVYNGNKDSVKKFQLTAEQLVPYKSSIYESSSNYRSWLSALLMGMALVGVGGWFWWWRQRRTSPVELKGSITQIEQPTDIRNQTMQDSWDPVFAKELFWKRLSPTHKELLEHIIKVSLSGRKSVAAEVNHILGVSHKGPDIQKKVRSDAFLEINREYQAVMRTTDLLVLKERAVDDKRMFDYFIHPAHLETIKPG